MSIIYSLMIGIVYRQGYIIIIWSRSLDNIITTLVLEQLVVYAQDSFYPAITPLRGSKNLQEITYIFMVLKGYVF